MKKTLKELQKLQLKYAEEIGVQISVHVEYGQMDMINVYVTDNIKFSYFNFYDRHSQEELNEEFENMKNKLKSISKWLKTPR